MLPKSNDAELKLHHHIDQNYIFFFQRWQEMLESKTLDMYQYNILNTYVACKELEDVIGKTMSGLFVARQNIDDCKEEALSIVKTDSILNKYNSSLQKMLLSILGSKVDCKKRDEINNDKNEGFYISLNRLKYQLMTPTRQLESSYLLYIMDYLKESIDNMDRIAIENSIASLISQCVYAGWSAKGLFELANYFKGSGTEQDKWQGFRDRIISNPKRVFEVYYSLKLETLPGLDANSIRQTIRDLGLNIQIGCDISQGCSNEVLNSKLSHDKTYAIVKVSSTDVYAGVLSAINILNSKLSIASFYNIISPWIANSPQIVVVETNSGQITNLKLTDIFKTYDYIDSNSKIFSYTKEMINNPSIKGVDVKLGAAFAYTSLSRSALFQETKYLSLWIALESLMRTGQYNDIITHIKSILPEIMSTRYIYRIIRNFIEDCSRCGYSADQVINIDMQQTDKRKLVKQMISIFRNEPEYQVLRQNCCVNSLLQYRCEEIHELMNDQNQIISKIEHYNKKIKWHIQRLYRIRNEITHSAFQQDKSLIIYIEHLYAYLGQMISEIVFCVREKGVCSVEESLAYLKENGVTFLEILKQGTISINNILPDGIMNTI